MLPNHAAADRCDVHNGEIGYAIPNLQVASGDKLHCTVGLPTLGGTCPAAGDGRTNASEHSEPADITSLSGLLPHMQMGALVMKTALRLAAACGLLTTLAFAQSAPPPAQEFVNKVAISDMFEIQSSQLALSKQADVDTKPFAEKMVTDHQKTSSELKSLIDSGTVKATLPTALDAQHQKMLDELKVKSGKDFDQSYDQIQVKAHQDAVALFEVYARGGDNPDLKSWAAQTLPHLKEHLSMAQKLK
jgi:putative membrane protein